jgi:hypothetical protein
MTGTVRRPWYLMLALIVAWIFGASAFVDGCSTVAFYREGMPDPQEAVARVHSDSDRAVAAKVAEQYFTTMFDARKRVFPLSVAGMLLGAVMVGFAARAMSGREGARTALIQVIGVQAILVIAAHFLTVDVRHAREALENTLFAAQFRDAAPDPESADRSLALYSKMLSLRESVMLVVRSVASGLIIVALTRSRSRRFFEAAEGRFSER